MADATLSLWAYVLQPTFLARVFAEYRGRSFEETLTFARFVDLIGAALVEHKGSGRQSFTRAQEQGTLETSSEAVYGKLRRVPLSLSVGFFSEGTARLRALLPPQHRAIELPASMADLTVVVGDGKTLKRVAKRLLPARGAAGKVYGGKLLVAFLPSQGVAVALAADPDGERNECRLVPQVVEQTRQVVSGPRLWVLDRQFCDLVQTARCSEDGDHFLIRYHTKVRFCPVPLPSAVVTQDAQGRRVVEDWGWLGVETNPQRRFVRRLTLTRPGEESIILVTDLLDAVRYPAADLLTVYLARWGIGVSREGSLTQSVQVRPRLTDSGLVAREAPGRESKPVKPSDNTLGKERAQRSRLQRTVNADVASLHATPVAEPVDNVRRQQGPSERSLPRRSSPAGYQRRHGTKGERATGEVRGVRRRKLAVEAWPITESGKWLGWPPDGGSGRSTDNPCAAKRMGREGPGPGSNLLDKERQG